MRDRRWDIGRVLERLGIQAKRKGKDWVALCPNPDHDDKNPSWRVKDAPGHTRHGLHKCWPCGFGGTLAELVITIRGGTVREAYDWIEGDDVVEDKPIPKAVHLSIGPSRRRFKLPDEVDFGPLEEWPKPPRQYISEERGVPAWQIERWGIGYAVAGRLEGRIVIPYRARGGRPRGYTARSFVGARKRYLEPKPEERAEPDAIFGEQYWPDEPKNEVLFLQEGAFNSMAVERALGKRIFIAAAAGSDMSPALGWKLAQFGRVVLLSDADDAGDKLARDIQAALGRHTTFLRVRLTGSDADALPRLRLREAVFDHLAAAQAFRDVLR